MRKLWMATFLIFLVATSCAVQQNNEPDPQTESASQTEANLEDKITEAALGSAKNVEDIMLLDIPLGAWNNSDLVMTSFEDENEMELFIETYLRERGTYRATPDTVYQLDQTYRLDCYTNDEENKTSLIAVDSMRINCVIYSHDDFKKIGSIAYDRDPFGRTIHESLYDAEENPVASVSYEYAEGIPFPLIGEIAGADQIEEFHYSEAVFSILNRSNKFWLYKDLAVFDGARVTGYNGNMQHSLDNYPYGFKELSYNKNGRLIKIHEAFPEEQIEEFSLNPNDYKSEINLDYRNDGTLKAVDYSFSWFGYGTWDCTGEIYYDGQGRMTHGDYYITHGRHYYMYLYEGESDRPWACIGFCTFAGGLSDFYLFQPGNKAVPA